MFLKDRSIHCKNLFADNKEICNKYVGFKTHVTESLNFPPINRKFRNLKCVSNNA